MRDTAPVFIQSLTLPAQSELTQKALKREMRAKGSFWIVDDSISAYDLYTYLKARFGNPNGLSMLFRSPSTDNFIQWHYTLKSGIHFVEIMGLNTRVEIWIEGQPNLGHGDWAALVQAIKADFKNYGDRLKTVRAEFEEWRLFCNPYHRLDSVIARYKERLMSIDVEHMELPRQPPAHPAPYTSATEAPSSDLRKFEERWRICANKYIEAQELCMGLRVLTPIWGESFINLLIFILAREELKKDRRLYEDYRRKEIDIRIKLLSVNCIGFAKPVDERENAFREFWTLMNERNDVLHGNTDPSLLPLQTVYFDGMIPLFPAHVDFAAVLKNSLVGIEPSAVLKGVQTVKSLIDYVYSLLEENVRKEVQVVMRTPDLGWRPATKRIGVLFSTYMIEGYAR